MNKKIILLVLVLSFFTIFNFSKIALADGCSVTIDNVYSLTTTCNNVDYNVSFLACGYVVSDYAATFTVSIGNVSETFQLLVNQSRTLSNGASFKLNSVLCAANQTQNTSTAVYSITPTQSQSCNDTDWFGQSNDQHIQRLATKGTCSDAYGTNTDYCLDSSMLNDYYCGPLLQDPKSCLYTTYNCKAYGFSGCNDGACVNFSSQTNTTPKCVASASSGGNSCTDSDGGKDYFVKGYSHVSFATGVSFDRQDSCNPSGLDSNVLREWCCLTDGTDSFEDYTCPYGCKDGACLSSPQESCVNNVVIKASDPSDHYLRDWNVFTIDPSGTYQGGGVWGNGAPIKTSNFYSGSTWNVNLNGGTYYLVIGQSGGESYGTYAGNFIINGTAVPFSNADVNHAIQFIVPYCQPVTTNVTTNACTDSDGGKNYYVKGTTSGIVGSGTGYVSWTDFCPTSTTVREHYCDETNRVWFSDYTCPYGCVDGACVPYVNENITPKCVNHDECSQACDNLGISFHWMGTGYNYKSWTGTCPSSVYGCMTGQCCLGQCPSNGSCYCLRTNAVDIYGSVCQSGTTCGQDCYCHPTNEEYKFYVKTDKYSYSPGEDVRITAVLSGTSNFDGSTVSTTITDSNGKTYNVQMLPVGTSSSSCSQSANGAYTCSITTEYNFVGDFNSPSDASGAYKVMSTAVSGGVSKNAEASFQVGSYSNYVDVLINPKEQSTIIGKEVDYDVTVTDKHVIPMCIIANSTSTCQAPVYTYLINVDGLPYNTVFDSAISVIAGGSKAIQLKVFPSSVKTSEGITTAVQQTAGTVASSERSVGVTGDAVAAQTGVSTETLPVREAVFRFTVKASLRDDMTVSNSDVGILHVKFLQTNQPSQFPETEKMSIELRKGWNLVSLPGKGIGFTQGSCSVDKKPVAFVYLRDQERYASIDEATSIMGSEELLNHLSTHSFWVYSYEDCNIGFNVDSYSTYSGLAVDSGWSLLGITKDMVGETINNIKGNCTFEKMYTWDSSSQKWTEISENDLIENTGYGIVAKTTAPCNFEANYIQPPAFPGG